MVSSTIRDPDTVDSGYWSALGDGRVVCEVCPRACKLHEGQRGLCFVRARQRDRVVLTTYGRSSGFCVDPIEKKPLNHFLPGTPVLSFGTAGCNLTCRFCQNWDISKSRPASLHRLPSRLPNAPGRTDTEKHPRARALHRPRRGPSSRLHRQRARPRRGHDPLLRLRTTADREGLVRGPEMEPGRRRLSRLRHSVPRCLREAARSLGRKTFAGKTGQRVGLDLERVRGRARVRVWVRVRTETE